MTTVAVILVNSDKMRFVIWLISIATARVECRGTLLPGEAVTPIRRPIVAHTDTAQLVSQSHRAAWFNDTDKSLDPELRLVS